MPDARAHAPTCERRARPVAPRGAAAAWSAHIHGWLLLLPAAVLLVTFTHYPAVATIIDSFFSTPQGRRGAVFVGSDNYQAMLDDPVFWRALANNLVYAASVIPLTDRAGAADGDLGQRQDRRPPVPAAVVLHADRAADDRGRQYLAVLLFAGLRAARPDPRPVRHCRRTTGSATSTPRSPA